MSKPKTQNKNSRFILEEKEGVVIASLRDDSDYSFEHTIKDMPVPRVRAPRYTKSQIKENSEYAAEITNETHEEFLIKNINGTNHEIHKSIHEIRKTLKRIQSKVQYILTAEEILDEIQKNT